MLANLTWADVDAFKRWCTRRFGVVFFEKQDVPGEPIVERALDLLKAVGVVGLPDGTEFGNEYSTTIGFVVLTVPYASPAEALRILTHELNHALNFWLHPDSVVWLYLTTHEGRANYEAGCMTAGAEAAFLIDGTIPAPADTRHELEVGYAIDDRALDLGVDLSTQSLGSVRA